MRVRTIGLGFAVAAVGATVGCGLHHPFKLTPVDLGPDRVHSLIEERLEDQRHEASGARRWERFKEDTYQSDEMIERHRTVPDQESHRHEVARMLLEDGAFSLDDCLAFSLQYNDEIQARRSAIEGVGAQALLEHSRFLPQIVYSLENESLHATGAEGWTHEREHTLRADQLFLEFGKEDADDVALRADQRQALFSYENEVEDVLSTVRTKFFTVLMRQRQIAQRHELLKEFQARYKRVQRLEQDRRVLEVDVLTARLNVLNEEERINALQREMLRQKTDLLHYTGLPLEMLDAPLAGAWRPFAMQLEEAIRLALRRSTDIAQQRDVVAEQLRSARQALWAYAPDFSLEAGRNLRGESAGVQFGADDGTFGLAGFAERKIPSEPPGTEYTEDEKYLNLSLELPLFAGLERHADYLQERAKLDEERHDLRNRINLVEIGVRKAYQTLLERRKRLEIQEETVNISRERLRVQEKLKELGRISDNELETFRERYFRDQDSFFSQQIVVMEAQESLRAQMRYFEPAPVTVSDVPAMERNPAEVESLPTESPPADAADATDETQEAE